MVVYSFFIAPGRASEFDEDEDRERDEEWEGPGREDPDGVDPDKQVEH